MAVSFAKNQDEIIKAWRDVVDTPDQPKWALFGYEGTTNNIKLISTGTQGLDELVNEFNCSLIQYAFCRVLDKEFGINKLVLINWQGDSSPLSRKGLCASHVGDVSNYFKGCTQTITIRNDDEATKEYLMDQIMKTAASKINLSKNQLNSNVDNAGPVGSTYKKTDISSDITSNRKSFWQQQEQEEKQRLAEEKKRAAEKQAQFERERKLREDSEAKKLAEKTRERDRLIEATRQADRKDSLSNNSVGSQPNSMMSTTNDEVDDDSRVGRRSELIRLERNQETQSLISKGLIKNKRAIFEQAQQQQQQQTSYQPTLTRRASGAMITQRLNTFKSLDSSSSLSSNTNDGSTANAMEKLTNGIAKHVKVNEGESATKTTTVQRQIEPVTLTKDDGDISTSTTTSTTTNTTNTNNTSIDTKSDVNNTKSVASPVKPKEEPAQVDDNVPVASENNNNGKAASISQDVNGNNKPIAEEQTSEPISTGGDQMMVPNGKHDIRALALYDYQAADNTEISFDPEDVIGSIQKVDPGWWHGKVVTGKYKGQIGLFPANYVQELSGE